MSVALLLLLLLWVRHLTGSQDSNAGPLLLEHWQGQSSCNNHNIVPLLPLLLLGCCVPQEERLMTGKVARKLTHLTAAAPHRVK
jgi:hypothetical protein